MSIKDLVTRWPVLRQIQTGGDGMHADAMSERTRNLAPKHQGAEVVRSVERYDFASTIYVQPHGSARLT
jgi:hypothetical protein